MPLLATLTAIWALSLVYVVAIHRRAARERAARRAGHAMRIAVRAVPPSQSPSGTLAADAHEIRRAILGVFTDRPRALPLAAAIVAGGGALFLVGDLVMDEPVLWPAGTAAGMPGWLRAILLGVVAVAVIANIMWIFFAARLTLSRERLVLNPDGVLEIEGAAMPALSPDRATLIAMSIPSAHGSPASGVTLEQNGLRFAFDYFGLPGADQWLHVMPAVPHDWWHIVLAGEVRLLDAWLETHYGPGTAPMARFRPAPTGGS